MKMNKKGFTLIELLAVIVILAIIALIATPLIMDVIEQSKKGAFESTAYGIVEAGELGYAQDVLTGQVGEVTFTYTNGELTSEPSGRSLDLKGTKPQNGQVKVNSNGEVALAIHDGTNCAQKGFDESEVTVSGKVLEECTIPNDEPAIVNADTSEASTPELTTGMIPVKWDGTNWIKADPNNEAGDNQWYDYDAKMWANAVTVTSTNRSTYESAAAGTTISMSDINTFWVWIPRYSYYITTSGTTTPSEIQIQFESKTDSKSTGDAVSTYLTHPAFTFGATEVNGMWIGKFETTGTIDDPTILPNATSLKYIDVQEMYNCARTTVNGNATIYGFSTDGDTHMMKNTEWGAVAYLSHSKYGINEEIYINPSSSYITGRGGNTVSQLSTTDASGSASSTLYSYDGKQCDTKTGYECTGASQSIYGMASSTTGNIYGIYDMSGGTSESVMGNYNYDIGQSNLPPTEIPDKYIDRYSSDREGTACSGGICYGHALSETIYWHGDYYSFFYSGLGPWLVRGGHYANNTATGIFSYVVTDGSKHHVTGFRLVQMKQ